MGITRCVKPVSRHHTQTKIVFSDRRQGTLSQASVWSSLERAPDVRRGSTLGRARPCPRSSTLYYRIASTNRCWVRFCDRNSGSSYAQKSRARLRLQTFSSILVGELHRVRLHASIHRSFQATANCFATLTPRSCIPRGPVPINADRPELYC